ncbi:MAG: DUF4474 domain-containing protein [Oscillospiraceae bacterium]|jgi:hypothetical protein|nr:DUF4474 domain-containing protein [Oscillospiraceae bacterium]
MILSILHTMIAFLISAIVSITQVGAASEAPGALTWDSGVYQAKMEEMRTIQRITTLGISPPPAMEITYDPIMGGIFDDMKELSGFDFKLVAADFPDIYYYNRWLYAIMPNQLNGLGDYMIAKGDAYDLEGNGELKALYRLFGSMVAMPKKAHIMVVPLEGGGENEYEVHIKQTYGDGSTAVLDTSIRYNAESGELWDVPGISAIGFDFNTKQNYVHSAESNPFQRILGYTKLYDDLLLQTTDMVNVETVRFKFPYQGKNWMLQLWKGRYFITSAGEVGLYNMPTDRLVEFYDAAADNERVPMSFKLKAVGVDAPLIDQSQVNHWWMTGFALRKYTYLPDKLTLSTIITVPDEEFRDGLIAALDGQKKAHSDLVYTVDGNTIKIAWGPEAN